MVEITVKMPDTLTRLPEAERDRLVLAGLHEAARARIRQLQAELAEAKQEVAHFEARYGMSLADFEAQTLAEDDSLQAHEDYNDWFYWHSVMGEKEQLLADLSTIEIQ